MNYAAADGEQIACLGNQRVIIQIQAQAAAAYVDNFALLVPVHGHAVAGKSLVHRVIGQRKIAGAMLYLFVIIQVMHTIRFLSGVVKI